MPRTKKDVVTEFYTGEILGAAGRVFAERGFEEATMDEIARAAGVAKGTLYLYYPSKQDIYSAAVHQSVIDLAARTTAAVENGGSIEEKLQAFIATRLHYFDEHRDFFRIYDREFGRLLCRHPAKDRDLEALYLEQMKMLDRVLQQAVRRHAVRPVRTDAAAAAIFDITRGLALRRLRGLTRGPIEDDIAFAFDLTWKGIGHR